MTDLEVVTEHRATIASLFPSLDLASFVPIGDGWDCFTYLTGEDWIVQIPRIAPAVDTLRAQIALLPELAHEVSAPIPVPVHRSLEPPAMAYRRIEGRSMAEDDVPDPGLLPERLGRFLYDLHVVPLEFVGLRGRGGEAWRATYAELLGSFRARISPMLDPGERERADAMFDAFLSNDANFRFPDVLIHQDLGPAHILMTPDGDLAGIIDWGDAGPGDPAMDFAWILPHAPAVGERALAAYGGPSDATFLDRVRFYDALGPWYEVEHGLDTDQPDFVTSGLEGIRERLPR